MFHSVIHCVELVGVLYGLRRVIHASNLRRRTEAMRPMLPEPQVKLAARGLAYLNLPPGNASCLLEIVS